MNKNKILVTGAAGFIGFHLINKLIENNFDVIGIDNLNSYYDVKLKRDRLAELKKHKNTRLFKFIELDITKKEDLVELKKSYSINFIFHLAALAGVRHSIDFPEQYLDCNITGFLNILEISKDANFKHLIYASSSSVYGNNKRFPSSESDNVDTPLSLYGVTKKTNELMSYNYSSLFNINTTGLRFFTVYGPWGRPDMALFKFTKNIISDKPIDVYNHGKHSRSFTYIDDIIESMYRLFNKYSLKNEEGKYRIFNIGGEKPDKLMTYIKLIEDKLNKKARINFLPMQPGDVIKSEADLTLLNNFISFKPETKLEKGISNFIDWYKEYYKIK